MYRFFADAEALANVAPFLLPRTGSYSSVVGHTHFGDLFLRDPGTQEYAILIADSLEVATTGEVEEAGFREHILANPDVIRTLLRPAAVSELIERLGMPSRGEAFFPVPLPHLGGSGELGTFQKGALWPYLAIVAQSIGGPGMV